MEIHHMICKCGYNFVQAQLEALRAKQKDPHVSYAVINDKNYKKFIKSEVKYYNAKDKAEKDNAFNKACTFIGTIKVCPECSRLTIVMLDEDSIGMNYYKKDGVRKY